MDDVLTRVKTKTHVSNLDGIIENRQIINDLSQSDQIHYKSHATSAQQVGLCGTESSPVHTEKIRGEYNN